jgi:hypothetical protein
MTDDKYEQYVKSLRSYGRPEPDPDGVPEWKRTEPPVHCPNCGGEVAEIRVRVKLDLLKGGKGTALYLGCPACPWASPAMTIADAASQH